VAVVSNAATLKFSSHNKDESTGMPFNFDLDRMKNAVESPSHRAPTNLSTEEFIEWMKSKQTKD